MEQFFQIFSLLCRDPPALQLLFKLFIERNHSLWRIPEVCYKVPPCVGSCEIFNQISETFLLLSLPLVTPPWRSTILRMIKNQIFG